MCVITDHLSSHLCLYPPFKFQRGFVFNNINKSTSLLLNNLSSNQGNIHTVIASYRGAVAPRSPGGHHTVTGAGQEADLGPGWHFLLITQAVIHAAGFPARSFPHTPGGTADAAV